MPVIIFVASIHSVIDDSDDVQHFVCTEVLNLDCELLQTVAAYFPSSSSSEVYGPFTVQLLTTESASPHVIVRDFVVSFNGKVNICILSCSDDSFFST